MTLLAAASHAQSTTTLLLSLTATHFYVDVVLAVLDHADVGVVDGLLVVFNAGRPVSSRTDHLESERLTRSAPSHPGRHSIATELLERQCSSLTPFACQDFTKKGNTCNICHLYCICNKEKGRSKIVLMLNNVLIKNISAPTHCCVAAPSHLSSSRCNRSSTEISFLLKVLCIALKTT